MNLMLWLDVLPEKWEKRSNNRLVRCNYLIFDCCFNRSQLGLFMSNRKNRVIFLGKLFISLGLLIYLSWLVDWKKAIVCLKNTDKFLLCIVPFVSLIGFCFASLRWKLILSDNNVIFSIKQAYRGYLMGLFYGHFLPGVLGGDVLRAGLCIQRTKCQISVAATSVLLERIAGITSLFGMAFFVYIFFPSIALPLLAIKNSLLVALIGIVGILTLIIIVISRNVWMRWLPKKNAHGFWSFVSAAMLTLATLKGQTLGLTLILSAMFQAADIIATFLLACAMNLDLPLSLFFAVIPFIYIATVFPISLGGLGVREGALVFFLAQFGVLVSDAIILSFLIYLNRMLIGSIGGSFHLIEMLATKAKQQNLTKATSASNNFK